MENTVKKFMSWGWIIFWFIVFWPLGLFFLLRRVAVDKSATLKSGKTISVISYILMGMGVIYLIMTFTESYSMFAPAVLFGGGGILVNRVAKKMTTAGERYKKYIALVVNQNQTSIDNIAPAIGVSYETAVKDLQKMIDSGYFHGAYIDVSQREIVLVRQAPQRAFEPSSVQVQTQLQVKVVTCGSCGANNSVIVGQTIECEYCGSPLQ